MAEKGHREGRLLSQRLVAEETGVSKTTIDRYARNEVQQYSTEVVETLLRYFDVTPHEFWEYVEDGRGHLPPESKTPLAAAF